MIKASIDPARLIPIYFRINRAGSIIFAFTLNGEILDITGGTFEFFIKRYPGDRVKLLSLTYGSGISFPVYSENELQINFTSSQTDIQEAEYYYEVLRTDTEETYANGPAYFSYGNTDSQ